MSAPAPPYSSGNRHAHQPELGQLRDELVGEAVLAVELLGDRRDALLRELADGRADELVLGREVEVHAAQRRGELDDQADAVAGAAALGEVVAAARA